MRSHEGALSNMSTVLLPPKPLEADMARGSGWRLTSPLSQSTPGLSMGLVSRSVGSSAPARMAMIVMAASERTGRAQAVSEIRFCRRHGNGKVAFAESGFVGLGLGTIVQRCASAVSIHIPDVIAAGLPPFPWRGECNRPIRFRLSAAQWDEMHRWSWPIPAARREPWHSAQWLRQDVSRIRTADPSPRLRPLRFWSKGEQGFGSSACRELNPLKVNGHSGSQPPARMMGAAPSSSVFAASAIAMAPDAQATETAQRGPRIPKWSPVTSATCANGYEAARNRPSGRRYQAAGSFAIPVSISVKPPRVLAMTTPLSRKAERSAPEFAIASWVAITASWSVREYLGSEYSARGGKPGTLAIVPSKPGYTSSFAGARQLLPDNMPACKQSSPIP